MCRIRHAMCRFPQRANGQGRANAQRREPAGTAYQVGSGRLRAFQQTARRRPRRGSRGLAGAADRLGPGEPRLAAPAPGTRGGLVNDRIVRFVRSELLPARVGRGSHSSSDGPISSCVVSNAAARPGLCRAPRINRDPAGALRILVSSPVAGFPLGPATASLPTGHVTRNGGLIAAGSLTRDAIPIAFRFAIGLTDSHRARQRIGWALKGRCDSSAVSLLFTYRCCRAGSAVS